jgi:hypothetical protein
MVYMVEVHFLSKQETRQEYQKSPYLQTISSKELDIRKNKYARRTNVRVDLMQFYYNSTLDFTYEEKEHIEPILKQALFRLENHFPGVTQYLLFENKLRLGKVEGSLDWHFPYTLNMTIILPEKVISQDTLERTLIHEMIHLHQKTQPHFYEEIYTNSFGFEKINPEKVIITSDYENNLVTNPDALRREWAIQLYDGLYLPAIVYINKQHQDCLFRLKKSSNPGYYISDEIPSIAKSRKDYLEMIQNCNQQVDHPNEIIACIITSNIFKNMV